MEHETKDKTVAKKKIKVEKRLQMKEKRDCNHVDGGLFQGGIGVKGEKGQRVETFSIL